MPMRSWNVYHNSGTRYMIVVSNIIENWKIMTRLFFGRGNSGNFY